MNSRVTHRLLKTIEPREKPFDVTDSELPGLLVRVQPTGSMTYYVSYRRRKDRRRNRVRLGSSNVLSPIEARDKAREILAEVAKGADPAEARHLSCRHTLASFLEQVYGPWVIANRKTGRQTLERLKYSFSELLDERLPQIRVWQVERWQARQIEAGRTVSFPE